MEAALSLGMTPAQAMRFIILPQAIRVVVPPLANYAVGLLKETALCSIIAAPELMLRAKDLASSSFLPMHAFVLAAVFYFVMSFPLMRAAESLEARMGAGRMTAMKVIVLGGGVVGVTTAFYLLRDGHEVTLVDRQPGVARECSHANGGFVAISQAVPWSAPGVPTKTLKTMAQPDAPILIHRASCRGSGAGASTSCALAGQSRRGTNTRHVLRLALYSFEALKEIRAATGMDYDARHRRRAQALFGPEKPGCRRSPHRSASGRSASTSACSTARPVSRWCRRSRRGSML